MKDFVFAFFLMNNYILKNIIIEFFHRIIFHEETDNFLKSEVYNGLSFGDDRVRVGLLFVSFDLSISNSLPSSRIFKLFDFFVNNRDKIVKLFLIEKMHLKVMFEINVFLFKIP